MVSGTGNVKKADLFGQGMGEGEKLVGPMWSKGVCIYKKKRGRE
jgi:hypothetical protein